MIVKIPKETNDKLFKFLALEANPTAPMKVIKVRKSKINDYGAEEAPANDKAGNDNTTAAQADSDKAQEALAAAQGQQKQTPSDEEPAAEEPQEDDDGGIDYTNDDGAEVEQPDQNDDPDAEPGEQPAEEPGEDGGTDYTDDGAGDADEEFPDDPQNGEEAPPEEEEQQAEPEVDPRDAIRKYNLFKDFVALNNQIKVYISKIEFITKNSIEGNMVVGVALNKLTAVQERLYEYLTIRYDGNSYIQSLFFYETTVATIKYIFDLIKNNGVFLKQ